jgi:hypothetical protein
MTQYEEYKDSTSRFTLEIYTFIDFTLVKMFDQDKEQFRMEYSTKSPVVVGAIKSLIKMMNNELYQYN